MKALYGYVQKARKNPSNPGYATSKNPYVEIEHASKVGLAT